MPKRSYGTGHLFARADKHGRVVWYGQWRVGQTKVKRTIGPKRQTGSREGLTRTQAERELRRRIEAETFVRPATARRTVLEVGEEYVDHLEHVMDRKATTIKDLPRVSAWPFRAVLRGPPSRPHRRGMGCGLPQAERGRGLSAKTVHNHLNFMHGLFKFAIKRGWTDKNPVALVDRPRKPHQSSPRLQFLQPVELDALIRAAPDDELGAVERPLYLTAAMTGMRQGELIALPWLDVDWVARRIRVADNFPRGRTDQVDTPKSNEGRSVPMAARVATELERHFQRSSFRSDSDFVFSHPQTGKPLDPSRLRKRFVGALKAAGVEEITFHELRHTFGTQLAAAGVPLRTIQEWMGHADAKTTEIYRHYAPDATHGADLVEVAFSRGGNRGGNLSESQAHRADLTPL